MRWSIIFGIGIVPSGAKFGLLFNGMDVGLSADLASLALQSQAFFIVILALIFFRDRPNMAQMLGMTIEFAGIGIVATTLDNKTSIAGLSLVLAGAFTWAVSNLLMKKAGTVNMRHLLVWIRLVPAIPLFCLSLIFEGWDPNRAAFAALDAKGIGAVLPFGSDFWHGIIRCHSGQRVWDDPSCCLGVRDHRFGSDSYQVRNDWYKHPQKIRPRKIAT